LIDLIEKEESLHDVHDVGRNKKMKDDKGDEIYSLPTRLLMDKGEK